MPLYLPQNESSFELPPSGMHPAICYRIIDLGTQNYPFDGKPNIGRYLLVSWELSITERLKDARPFSIGKRWKHSSHEKSTMRKDLEAWRGKKFQPGDFGTFDITKIVGAKCMLNIQHAQKDDSEYANIVGIGPAVKGMEFQPQYNAAQILVLEKGQFSARVFDLLSDNLKERISQSPEYIDLHTSRNGAMEKLDAAKRQMQEDLNDEVPF